MRGGLRLVFAKRGSVANSLRFVEYLVFALFYVLLMLRDSIVNV